MAKSWSGFVPQNRQVLEQWGAMEASSQEIIQVLLALPQNDDTERKEDSGDMFAGWPYDLD
jgi:hypothetical protein